MKLLLVFVALLFVGCEVRPKVADIATTTKVERYNLGHSDKVWVVVIDNHDYLVMRNGNRGGITHKADCITCEKRL